MPYLGNSMSVAAFGYDAGHNQVRVCGAEIAYLESDYCHVLFTVQD